MPLKPIGIDDDNTFPGRVGDALAAHARAAVAEALARKIEPAGDPRPGQTLVFDGTAWVLGPGLTVGATPPPSPQVNDLWVDTSGTA